MATPIEEALAESARRYTHRAVESFVRGDFADFCLAAGIAVELAVKTRLAQHNVAFIAPDNGFKSAAALWRMRDNIEALPLETRTVSASEGFKRLAELEPKLNRYRRFVDDVCMLRNGEAHLGLSGLEDHDAALSSFLAVSDGIRIGSPEELWGEHADFVQVHLEESAESLARQVEEKITRARLRFTERFGGLSADQQEVVFAIIRENVERHTWAGTLEHECPVCGSPCLVDGHIDVDFDIDWDHREGVPIGGQVFVVFSSYHLACGACGLDLDGADEIERAGIDPVLNIEDADSEEYLREYYAQDES